MLLILTYNCTAIVMLTGALVGCQAGHSGTVYSLVHVWYLGKQKTVSKSSAEAEYRSMSTIASELVWISSVMKDLLIPNTQTVTLYCDNKAAQHIAANPVFHECTKHLNIDCHYVRDKVIEGFLQNTHVSSEEQLANLMTKPLGESRHRYLSSRLGLLDAPPIPP